MMTNPEKSPTNPHDPIPEMSGQQYEQILARIWLLEQHILLNHGSQELSRMRKRINDLIPYTIRNYGLFLLEEFSHKWNL